MTRGKGNMGIFRQNEYFEIFFNIIQQKIITDGLK
jgi:hypothetical protein